MPRRLRREEYTVGWVCALPIELAAAREILDEKHDNLERDENDENLYQLGMIEGHNVVIVCLPAGRIGSNPAAAVAMQMQATFKGIQFGLMVGIGGGVPSRQADIRLGDVVVSQPHQTFGGVVQYDVGKTTPNGFEQTGSLNSPPQILLNAVSIVRANKLQSRNKLSEYLSHLRRLSEFRREAAGPDFLFEATYNHVGGQTCDQCDADRQVHRQRRENEEVTIHYGTIASGNRVMRDGRTRDRVSAKYGGILCFEMEAAGLMNSFPCLVIRGICDYADSHKNKRWQAFATGTAAAFAKELLSVIPPTDTAKIKVSVQMKKEDQECIQHLRVTDPRDDKERIEDTKGGLLEDSYRWILENPDYQQWRNNEQNRLLWVKGDPGKGKTMLLCGIIDELKKSMTKTDLLSYFFCQATDSRINSATAVLRGLIYLLVDQQPSLISYVRKKHDHGGKGLFEDTNSWVALSKIFTDILQDPSLNNTYLIIDALDECVTDLQKLLDFIAKMSSGSPRVKWIVSGRNSSDIEEQLQRAGHKVRLSLELNAESVSTAVSIYIQHKVDQLARQKKYDNKTRDAVLDYLSSNANDTFLWVALICQNLEKISRWSVLTKLNIFPPGLDPFYERMMAQLCNSDNTVLCKSILASIAVVYRPITLKELTSLVEMIENMSDDLESLSEMVGLCGSFLTIREGTIYFVHQSAKDYLLKKASNKIFPFGIEDMHHEIFSRSLQVVSRTVQRDIYGLRELGYPIERVKQPESDPLAVLRYSYVYWIDHLLSWNANNYANNKVDLQDKNMIDAFLRKKYLYWLESLSLCRSISQGVISIAKLEGLIQVIL
jgi:nucleoside phosphorylase/Cdc6-like AAA superfamily ATPase